MFLAMNPSTIKNCRFPVKIHIPGKISSRLIGCMYLNSKIKKSNFLSTEDNNIAIITINSKAREN